jgi:hypothetical protein
MVHNNVAQGAGHGVDDPDIVAATRPMSAIGG